MRYANERVRREFGGYNKLDECECECEIGGRVQTLKSVRARISHGYDFACFRAEQGCMHAEGGKRGKMGACRRIEGSGIRRCLKAETWPSETSQDEHAWDM